MEWVQSVFLGIGLSAACGFRVFVPLLGMSIFARTGQLTLAPGFEWIGSWLALVVFAVATAVEVVGYYIPWVDNLLDSIATPAAVIAGSIVMASQVGDVSPLLRWGLGIIAGGGVAATIQGGSVLLRGVSTATTGGVGNPAVSTGELAASAGGTALAVFAPVIAVIIVALICLFILSRIVRWLKRRKEPRADEATETESESG